MTQTGKIKRKPEKEKKTKKINKSKTESKQSMETENKLWLFYFWYKKKCLIEPVIFNFIYNIIWWNSNLTFFDYKQMNLTFNRKL